MTIAQRARLVVALGILNLVLAGLALAVGAFGGPVSTPPPGGDTAARPSSTPAVSEPSSSAVTPSSAASPTPVPPSPSASATAALIPTPAPVSPSPTIEPTPNGGVAGATPTPSGIVTPPLVSGGGTSGPLSRPTPGPTPRPTPVPTRTPAPTVRPTPNPTPTPPPPTPSPKPKHARHARPACPGSVSGPPGHNKGATDGRPCSGRKAHHVSHARTDRPRDDAAPKPRHEAKLGESKPRAPKRLPERSRAAHPQSGRHEQEERSGGKGHSDGMVLFMPLSAAWAAWTAARRRAAGRSLRGRTGDRRSTGPPAGEGADQPATMPSCLHSSALPAASASSPRSGSTGSSAMSGGAHAAELTFAPSGGRSSAATPSGDRTRPTSPDRPRTSAGSKIVGRAGAAARRARTRRSAATWAGATDHPPGGSRQYSASS